MSFVCIANGNIANVNIVNIIYLDDFAWTPIVCVRLAGTYSTVDVARGIRCDETCDGSCVSGAGGGADSCGVGATSGAGSVKICRLFRLLLLMSGVISSNSPLSNLMSQK